MKKSLQQIEDFYLARGYNGNELRKVLAKDAEYQKLVKERKKRLTKQFTVTKSEKKKYLLSLDADFQILAMCKQLERLRLTRPDNQLLKITKSQLEHEWRKSLLRTLHLLIKKYKKKKITT